MSGTLPDLLLRLRLIIGLLAIGVCAGTWWLDLSGMVYECPFCRAQRTVIGLLGLLLMMPWYAHWSNRYLAAVIASFGIVNASMQHFGGWARIMSGEFELGEKWYINPWLLSGCALFIIMALVLLIWRDRAESDDEYY